MFNTEVTARLFSTKLSYVKVKFCISGGGESCMGWGRRNVLYGGIKQATLVCGMSRVMWEIMNKKL